MANNFTTIQQNQASDKFYLVRIEPARYVNDDLSSIGGGQYEMTFSYPIAKVEENGTALTSVTSGLSSGEYLYDETTNTLQVHPGSAPSSTNAIVVFYYLFYTGGRFRVVSEDPENTNTTSRDWLPRIQRNPEIKSSVKDVVNGFLNISSSSLVIINDLQEFNQYMTINDSFNQKDIKIWLCLNSSDNIQKIYDGKIINVGLTRNKVTFKIDDPLSKISRPALNGDDSVDTFFNLDDFANVQPFKEGSPIPMIFGSVSRYKLRPKTITNLSDAREVLPDQINEAVCTDYSNTLSTTTNREWGCCRVVDGFVDFSFTPSNIDNSDANFTRLDGTSGEIAKFHIGDTFVVNDGGVDRYCQVHDIDTTNNYLYVTKQAALTTGDDVEANDCPVLVIADFAGETYYPLYGQDYTATVTNTAGGNKYLKITFADNFESNHSGLTTLDPGAYRVFYRVSPDTTNAKHGSVVKKLLEGIGLTVNAASITAANSALATNCAFSIPNFDETEYNPYYKYIQDILKSTLGYLTLNNDFEIEYKLFASPSSSTVLDNVDIERGSLNVDVEYKDIVTQLIAFNPHYNNDELTADSNNTPTVSEKRNKAVYLHGIVNTDRFRHVLERMDNKISDIMDVLSERQAYYDLNSKIINVNNIIGDDLQLETEGILGSGSSKDLKIISINKSPERTKMTLTDLGSL